MPGHIPSFSSSSASCDNDNFHNQLLSPLIHSTHYHRTAASLTFLSSSSSFFYSSFFSCYALSSVCSAVRQQSISMSCPDDWWKVILHSQRRNYFHPLPPRLSQCYFSCYFLIFVSFLFILNFDIFPLFKSMPIKKYLKYWTDTAI